MKYFISIALSLFLLFSLLFILAEQTGWMGSQWVSEQVLALQGMRGGRVLTGAAIAGLLTIDLILPVPSSVLMTMAGALLGFNAGWMVNLIGAMGSAVLGFVLCRRWGKPMFDRLIKPSDSARITRFFERYGIWAILLSRSVPMLSEVISCMAGLSAMRSRIFFAVALAGTWPLCIAYAWAGDNAVAGNAIGLAVMLAFVLPAIGLAILKFGFGRGGQSRPTA
jgi:3-dehydroquinate synthase